MRRELIIVFSVLVPFGALVAAAFAYALQGAPDGAIAVNAPRLPGTKRPAAALVPEPTPALAALDAGALTPSPERAPAELAAPLKAVERQVATCFDDEHSRAPQGPKGVELTVAFTPTRAGAFAAVTISSSWHDPYLQACVEDVFAEAHFLPTGLETFTPAVHTFALGQAH
jgi:hypothetical protein